MTLDGRRTLDELLGAQGLAVLATEGEEGPYCSLVAIVATSEGRIVFATTRSTRKYANLVRSDRVSVMVDDRRRGRRDEDFHTAHAATGVGTAREVCEADRARFADKLLARHPYLAEFVGAPTCAVFEMTVTRWTVVGRFQEVVDVVPEP